MTGGLGPEDAFGYRPEVVVPVVGVQVGEGKDGQTLEPAIIVSLRIAGLEDQPIRFGLNLILADHLASQLPQWIARAREKHWE